jgi:thioredoxin-dependent peroxiredoxin
MNETLGMPVEGDEAPDFSLPDETGTMRTLSSARGRWLVLYFYPKDDSPGCATESCEFRDAHRRYTDAGAEVWGVSILGSASKAAFKQKLGLPFALLADEDHAVAERYGTWVEKQQHGRTYWGVQRATFLIDPEGRIAHVWPRVKPEGHADEVLAVLRERRATAAETAR